MKPLKKLDNYLLENHPLIWMSKLHYVLPSALILNFISWIWGYFSIDSASVMGYIGEKPYFDSYVIFYFLLVGILYIILWSLAYFKKSAVRHLYPLGKLYFVRLLVVLFINFLSISLIFVSFSWGYRSKIQSLANYEELKKEIGGVNEAMAFLPAVGDVTSGKTSSYTQLRLFEAKNPGFHVLSELEWSGGVSYSGFDYDPSDHPENNDTLFNGELLQCLEISYTYNKCEGNQSHYSGHIRIPKSYLKNYVSLFNLVDECFPEESFLKSLEENGYYYYYSNDFSERTASLDFNKRVNAIGHSEEKIKLSLEKFEDFLSKHNIEHALNPAVIAKYYAQTKGLRIIPMIETSYSGFEFGADDDYNRRKFEEFVRMFKTGAKNATVADLMKNTQESQHIHYFVEYQKIRELFSNARQYSEWQDLRIFLIAMMLFSLGLAFIFMLLSFVDFIKLLIAIPIAAIFVIITVVIMIPLTIAIRGDSMFLIVPMIVATFILMFYLNLLRAKKSSKLMVHISAYLSALLSPLYLIGIVGLMALLNGRTVYECGWYSVRESVLMRWIEDPGFILILSATGILLYTATIKKLLSKPD